MERMFVLLLLCVGTIALPTELKVEIVNEQVGNTEECEVTAASNTRNAINTHHYTHGLWPNGIVYYTINHAYSATVANLIREAQKEIEEDTKVHGHTCVQFVERTHQTDYVEYVPTHGCHSPIGRQRGHKLISLGSGCWKKGTIMHETLHTLGFFHEHERYDRDNYVDIHIDNIPTDKQSDFEKETTTTMNTLGISYDYGSVMHYGAYTFAKDPSKPTITPKDSTAVIGQRLALSKKDVQKIQTLYSCGLDLSHVAAPTLPTYFIDCNFESATCNHLHQDTTDNFDWIRHSGPTHTAGTGPTADLTNGAGNYFLAEARHHHNQVASIYTDELQAGYTCVVLNYFMHGPGIKSLKVRAKGNRIDHTFKTFSGDQGSEWHTLHYTLNVHAAWHLYLEADIGASDQGDIAIDDLKIYHGHC